MWPTWCDQHDVANIGEKVADIMKFQYQKVTNIKLSPTLIQPYNLQSYLESGYLGSKTDCRFTVYHLNIYHLYVTTVCGTTNSFMAFYCFMVLEKAQWLESLFNHQVESHLIFVWPWNSLHTVKHHIRIILIIYLTKLPLE